MIFSLLNQRRMKTSKIRFPRLRTASGYLLLRFVRRERWEEGKNILFVFIFVLETPKSHPNYVLFCFILNCKRPGFRTTELRTHRTDFNACLAAAVPEQICQSALIYRSAQICSECTHYKQASASFDPESSEREQLYIEICHVFMHYTFFVCRVNIHTW